MTLAPPPAAIQTSGVIVLNPDRVRPLAIALVQAVVLTIFVNLGCQPWPQLDPSPKLP